MLESAHASGLVNDYIFGKIQDEFRAAPRDDTTVNDFKVSSSVDPDVEIYELARQRFEAGLAAVWGIGYPLAQSESSPNSNANNLDSAGDLLLTCAATSLPPPPPGRSQPWWSPRSRVCPQCSPSSQTHRSTGRTGRE